MSSTELFKSHVTSTAFSLTLSSPMIETLCQIDQLGSKWCKFMTFYALKDRGLIERVYEGEPDAPMTKVKLSEAGKAVIPLIKLSGLYKTFPQRDPPVEIPQATVKLKETT